MPYSTTDDVLAMLPGEKEIDVSTSPSLSDITGWIAKVSDTIDVALTTAGIDTSTLTAKQQSAVSLVCTKEVAYMVEQSAGAAVNNQYEPLFKSWHSDYEAFMKMIEGGTWSPDTVTSSLPSSRTMDAEDLSETDPEDPTMQPKFTWAQKW